MPARRSRSIEGPFPQADSVKLCALGPGVRLGAEIVGLNKVAEIHDDEGAGLRAFARA
jgi:hypothetical protein